MPRLILVGGASGGGKSKALAALPATVLKIGVDAVLYDAARRAFPFVRQGREHDWAIWPRDPGTIDLPRLLELALMQTVPRCAGYCGNVVAEGAILINDWFRLPFCEALARLGMEVSEAHSECLFLDPPAPVLLEQIHRRAETNPYRRHELRKYPDLASVERLRAALTALLTPGRWQFVTSTEALTAVLEKQLDAA